MLIANLWVEAGLVNGAVATVVSICYENGGLPNLPFAVMVRFDNNTGPTLADQTCANYSNTSYLVNLSVKLFTVTYTSKMDKVVIDIK